MTDLRTELLTDPLGRGYAGMTDAQCAADLNEKRHTLVESVMVNLRTICAIPEHGQQIKNVLKALPEQIPDMADEIDWLDPYQGGIDVGHPETRQQIDGLVTAQLLTTEQANALKALAEQPASRAEVLGLGTIHHLQVAEARNGDV